MAAALPAMFLVMLSWLAWGCLFIGLGSLARPPGDAPGLPPPVLFRCFWVGWAAAVVFLQIWHFWLPVNSLALALVVLAGVGGLVRLGRQGAPRDWPRFPGRLLYVLLGGLLLLWVANHALHPPRNIDSGLYHLQAIRWTVSYPLVPGLGNLHGRLAFNNSYFLYPALLAAGPWAGRVSHFANSLLVAVFLLYALWCAFQVPRTPYPRQLSYLYTAFFLAPVLDKVYRYNLASPSPDLALFLLGAVLSGLLVDLVLTPPASPATASPAAAAAVFLAAAGVTLKSAFLPLGLGLGGGALYLWVRRAPPAAGRRPLLWAAGCLLLVVLPWLGRGVVLSGYPLYPAAVGAFPVQWRLPAAQARQEADWIRGYARDPQQDYRQVLDNWRWLGPWLQRAAVSYDVAAPLALLTLTGVAAALYARRRRAAGVRPPAAVLLLTPPLLSILAWFLAAPDPRLVGAAFWMVAAAAAVLVLRRFSPLPVPPRALLVVGALYAGVALAPLLPHLSLVAPGPDYGFHPTPVAFLDTRLTASGLALHVPRDRGLCWDAGLPCTPFPNPGLRWRRPGDLGGGFLPPAAAP